MSNQSGDCSEYEWGVRHSGPAGSHISNYTEVFGDDGEEKARETVRVKRVRPGQKLTLVRRKVTYTPWIERG